MRHYIKCDLAPFIALWEKEKSCEIRFNDRCYATGDELIVVHDGRQIRFIVTHVQTGYGLKDGYAALSIREYWRGAAQYD